MKTLIDKITSKDIDKKVIFSGWIVHLRSSWKVAFLELRDGSWYIQCVIESNKVGVDKFEKITSCGIETSLEITWIISKHPKKDEFEVQVDDFKIITKSKDYPLWQKEHGVEYLFDNRHLHLRSKRQRSIQRIRDTIIHATYDWMRDHDFIKYDSPIFTPSACEWTTELYEVEHVNWEKMYLTQSWQLYLEAWIMAHGRVFDFWPCFRAEHCKTRKHLNELWMMDAEAAFVDNEWNMQTQEQLMSFIVQEVLKRNMSELKITWRDISKLEKIKWPFPRITHSEAVKRLQELGSDIKDWEDLWADDEELLMKEYDKPLFITERPLKIKAFYMKENPKNPWFALCSDLIWTEWAGELIWWSQREESYDKLIERIKEHNLPQEYFDRYLDSRKYWGIEHSGFWYWLERIVRWICDLPHVRESIPFPRYANRITP